MPSRLPALSTLLLLAQLMMLALAAAAAAAETTVSSEADEDEGQSSPVALSIKYVSSTMTSIKVSWSDNSTKPAAAVTTAAPSPVYVVKASVANCLNTEKVRNI